MFSRWPFEDLFKNQKTCLRGLLNRRISSSLVSRLLTNLLLCQCLFSPRIEKMFLDGVQPKEWPAMLIRMMLCMSFSLGRAGLFGFWVFLGWLPEIPS